MNREDMKMFFEVLEKAVIHLFKKADAIHNMNETFSSTMKQEKLLPKNLKLYITFPTRKWETITVVTCCKAGGNFLPPFCNFKRKNEKQEIKAEKHDKMLLIYI